MARSIPLDQLPVFSRENYPEPDFDFAQGAVFLVNKPKGWSSFGVVKRLRKVLNIRKVGHAGTLDPLATGLLVLCAGRATKSIEQIQELPKTYLADITFGASTFSYDGETEVNERAEYEQITENRIDEVMEAEFSGEIEQIPPMYSAVKHQGKPLYKKARKGETVERKPRMVSIYSHKILRYQPPVLSIEIKCSKGTYIRSLADDLGKALQSRAYMSGLKRTAIGHFPFTDAYSIDNLNNLFTTHGEAELS